MPSQPIHLPPYLVDSQLVRTFNAELPGFPLINANTDFNEIEFDWSRVKFFDDYALLKLLFVQRLLRSFGLMVRNIGFVLAHRDPHRAAVLGQLFAVELPELIASGHLTSEDRLKAMLAGDAELLESNPLRSLDGKLAESTVIPLLCSHDLHFFSAGSREEKLLDRFIRAHLRPAQAGKEWDLIESRDFRHMMIQQLRRNVQEHARKKRPSAIGLAILRIWTSKSLREEWQLAEQEKTELLRSWADSPIPTLIRRLDSENAVLQISIMDDGLGIPESLERVYEGLPKNDGGIQTELFASHEASEFDKRFRIPAAWPDKKAMLIAFATDFLGTSKVNRPPEEKGLEYLRNSACKSSPTLMLRLESDGSAVGQYSPANPYGVPSSVPVRWVPEGGTGISVAALMLSKPVKSEEARRTFSLRDFRSSDSKSTLETIKVREYLSPHAASEQTTKDERERLDRERLERVTEAILGRIILPEIETDIDKLRGKGILIVDWGEFTDKSSFHHVLVKLAMALAATDARQMRPFVFSNLPKAVCGLIPNAFRAFSKTENPTPVCAFAAGEKEPYWIGLDTQNWLAKPLRLALECRTRRKITDQQETLTEAFLRDYLTKLLNTSGFVFPSDPALLSALPYQIRKDEAIQTTLARVTKLIDRCSLFRSEWGEEEREAILTGRLRAIFTLPEIEGEVDKLFLKKFVDIFTTSPVCFEPRNPREGVSLPHSARLVRRYFRSDALVESPIAMELAQELTAIALSICAQSRSGRIDWVVSCTSPVQWFVNRIVDGLAEHGIYCSHHVFPSYEALPDSFKEIGIRKGDTVLAFTDVIATGRTAYTMGTRLRDHFEVRIAGLISLADIRTAEDRSEGPNLEEVYGDAVFCLYNKSEVPNNNLVPAYYVHPETVVPKRWVNPPEKEFFGNNYAGVGPLVTGHAILGNPQNILDLLISRKALHFGHFQHGGHHSEVFVDVEALLADRSLRNVLVNALFRYIIENDIKLVLYPSHSSAYLLIDELRHRFAHTGLAVEFSMACRTFRGTRGTNYALTRFSPNSDTEWKRFSKGGVLIIDDAVCSGATAESIVAELARLERNYYESQRTPRTSDFEPGFRLHVVGFLSRLPRVTGEFWNGLARLSAGRLQFSAVLTMPLAVHPPDLCPQCRLVKRLRHGQESEMYCLYSREFLSWWRGRDAVILPHQRRSSEAWQQRQAQPEKQVGAPFLSRFSDTETLRLAGYISAIERSAYVHLARTLVDPRDGAELEPSRTLRVHVRSRAVFIEGETVDHAPEAICGELSALLDVAFADAANLSAPESVDCALEILTALTQRYLPVRPSPDELVPVIEQLVKRLGCAFDERLIFGGVMAVLDTGLSAFASADHAEAQHKICAAIRQAIAATVWESLPEGAALMLDWLDAYLAEGDRKLDSVGNAVRILADCAKTGPRYHVSQRNELDDLRRLCVLPTRELVSNDWEGLVKRTRVSSEYFLRLLRATHVLKSAITLPDGDLAVLQDRTEREVERLRNDCREYLTAHGRNDAEEMFRLFPIIKQSFLQLYESWFSPERLPIAKVIGYFTPELATLVEEAWNGYVPKRLPKSDIHFDREQLSDHKSLKVIMDPTLLRIAIQQFFDNIDKTADLSKRVDVRCEVRTSKDKPEQVGVRNIQNGKVVLAVTNTGTHRADRTTIKERGLADLKIALGGYGAELSYTPLMDGEETFRVTTTFVVWET